MALIKCPECGKEISDKSDLCIGCGYPISREIESVEEAEMAERCEKLLCRSCGSENEAGEDYCAVCGMRITPYVTQKVFAGEVGNNQSRTPRYRGKLKWIAIAVLATLFIGLIVGGDKEKPEESGLQKGDKESATMQESGYIEPEEQGAAQAQEPELEISEEKYKAACGEYAYKDVLRNPENYIGEKIKITAKISNVHEAGLTNPTKYYFAYTESKYGWSGDRYAIYDKRAEQDPKLLSDDIITVWGEIADPEQAVSLILASEELFVIDMKYVELVSE